MKKETELSKKAKEYIAAGQLVPDKITIGMVKERLSREDCNEKGFYLDGFPRTIAQAEALAGFSEVDMVVNFKANPEIIIQRLSGRRICRDCGSIFHVQNVRPKVDGVCDHCEGELYQRDDDQPEAIKERLQVYEEQTAPLIDYYQEKGLLKEVHVNEDFGTHKELILGRIYGVIEDENA